MQYDDMSPKIQMQYDALKNKHIDNEQTSSKQQNYENKCYFV